MAKKTNYWYVLVFTNEGPVYVTGVNYKTKVAQWDKNEAPLEMTREAARDLHLGLSVNFTHCVVVNTIFPMENQPYRYDMFELVPTRIRKEDEEKGE